MDSRYEGVEQHLDDYVARLNARSGEYAPRSEPQAQKQHQCECGCPIERGSKYFRKLWSPDRREDGKRSVSTASVLAEFSDRLLDGL